MAPELVDPPDLPELRPVELPVSEESMDLELSGVLLDRGGLDPLHAGRIRIVESELRGVAVRVEAPRGFTLSDVVLRSCELSNLDAREGSVRRVDVRGSRLTGLSLSGAMIEDLKVQGSSLKLASLAFARLRRVVFEEVDLAEASFMDAHLEQVTFSRCSLTGVDFRGAKLKDCVIRGSSLDTIVGVQSLDGVTMPWPDVLASAAAMASALGISIEMD
jgi:uncharacterized protein YjbI with pentapeptide repeats